MYNLKNVSWYMIILPPKKSRCKLHIHLGINVFILSVLVGNFSVTPIQNMQPHCSSKSQCISSCFMLFGDDITQIKSLRSHNQMFMQLAFKQMTEWEALSRMLNVSESNIYTIKMDNIHSVREQMFQHWMRKNGSRATLHGCPHHSCLCYCV